ncbi:MAG: Transcriptional regulator, LysR family [Olavius algarvensis Delta 4 endosymbiont]|nr:MAG: Transcriptional regulator, LysR family [Olavius algarvensis Delta 4 endosymbiont]
MNLPIDYLRTFIAVADTGGFTSAGQQINRSQSAVSMQIKRLEDETGKVLFDRVGKSVGLTPEGNLLINFARRIVKEHDAAVAAISGPGLQGRIRFGSPEHYTVGVLPGLLARFAASYPDVRVEMRCENSDRIKAAIDQGTLDIGLCTQISEGGEAIYHDPVVWVTDPGYLAAGQAALPLAVFEEDCIFRSWAVEALEKAGLRYQIVYVSRSISGLLDAVRAGLAVAPIVKSNVPADLKIAGPEKGLPTLPVSNVVLHMAPKPVSEPIACFAEHLRSSFREKG